MERIKDTIQAVMGDLKAGKTGFPADAPEELLKKILTKRELKHIKFNYFKRGVLGASVDSSSWLYQISLRKEDLLAQLTAKSKAIKDIRFRLGDIK